MAIGKDMVCHCGPSGGGKVASLSRASTVVISIDPSSLGCADSDAEYNRVSSNIRANGSRFVPAEAVRFENPDNWQKFDWLMAGSVRDASVANQSPIKGVYFSERPLYVDCC